MSLIERALERVRTSGEPADAGATRRGQAAKDQQSGADAAGQGVEEVVLAKRVADSPQLAVDEEFLRRVGLRAPVDQVHQQMAEYRHIKRQLLEGIRAQGDEEHARVILVTSAMAGEGKTFSAANLALSLALEPDFSVLLIDGDVIKPALSRLFGLQDRPGLMEAAKDANVDPESLVVTTSMEGLSIMPAGRADANATEYFGSARMANIIHQLRTPANRIVVIDSLPLLLTTEARTLLPHAGQALLVVRADYTPQSAVMQALELLEGNEHVKLLLNATIRSKLGQYYGNGYGYQYNYAAQGAPAKSKES